MVHMIRTFNCVCNRRVTEALKWILNFVKYLSPIFPTYLMVEKPFFFFVFATLSGVETLKYPPFFLLKDAFKTKTLGLVAWKNNSSFAVRRYDKIPVRTVFAHVFIIAICNHSDMKWTLRQRTFLQYSCSATMTNIVKNIYKEKFMN